MDHIGSLSPMTYVHDFSTYSAQSHSDAAIPQVDLHATSGKVAHGKAKHDEVRHFLRNVRAGDLKTLVDIGELRSFV